MQTEKIITYTAIGIAGLICLIFLLDLVAGIFGRNLAMDILFILGGAVLALAGRGDDPRASIDGSTGEPTSNGRAPLMRSDRSAATCSTSACTKPSQV